MNYLKYFFLFVADSHISLLSTFILINVPERMLNKYATSHLTVKFPTSSTN